MSTTVYWSIFETEWQRAEQPTPLQKILNNKYLTDGDIPQWLSCPAARNYSKNIFGLHSLYQYNFHITPDGSVVSDLYDQSFFNNHIIIRSIPNKLFSFTQRYVFFSEENLDVTFELQPHFENNAINQRCVLTPGRFNIGKYFRCIDFSFFLKPEYDSFIINEGDVYQYIQFHTNSKIKFKQFVPTQELLFLEQSNEMIKQNKNTKYSLDKYYSFFKTKNTVIKKIKQNLI